MNSRAGTWELCRIIIILATQAHYLTHTEPNHSHRLSNIVPTAKAYYRNHRDRLLSFPRSGVGMQSVTLQRRHQQNMRFIKPTQPIKNATNKSWVLKKGEGAEDYAIKVGPLR